MINKPSTPLGSKVSWLQSPKSDTQQFAKTLRFAFLVQPKKSKLKSVLLDKKSWQYDHQTAFDALKKGISQRVLFGHLDTEKVLCQSTFDSVFFLMRLICDKLVC